MSRWCFSILALIIGSGSMDVLMAEESFDLKLQLQSQQLESKTYQLEYRQENWSAKHTAIIVCDVWDYHHCYNAVKRLEQFAPRLNQVVAMARQSGCTVIHAPSDCMDAYVKHPARVRATKVPLSSTLPHAIGDWCSQLPAEEMVVYPIDQSDGGEDDDPEDHARWASELERLGRNPKMPWKKQLATIEIDPSVDFISDRGEEVWSILESRGIRNVILAGVHVNMCVLGRPFGLRQLARNGKNVVLMSDMTDSMYNPKRWPYVSHHEGTRRIITHIERHICPTITSDQLLGGQPFQWQDEVNQPEREDTPDESKDFGRDVNPRKNWGRIDSEQMDLSSTGLELADGEFAWFRRVIKLSVPEAGHEIRFSLRGKCGVRAWLDGVALRNSSSDSQFAAFPIPSKMIQSNDYHLLAICLDHLAVQETPRLLVNGVAASLVGQWEYRIANSDDASMAKIPLPAKFGGAADIVYELDFSASVPQK